MYITLPPLKRKRKVYEINLFFFVNIIYIHVYDTLTSITEEMTTSNINYFRLMKKVKVMKYNLKIQFELDLGKMTVGISNS